jgi:ElaB/YqjD/DUF883 family membrane-anchored ribosome-binding protein
MSMSREARNTIDEIEDAATDTTREGAAKARAGARRFAEHLRANGSRLEDELREASGRFASGARKFGEAASEQIREHPLAAFGIAFAAGVVLSRALRSR